MMPGALRYIARKATLAVVTAAGAVVLVSAFLHLVPGDPVDSLLGEEASVFDREVLRQCVGYQDPALDPAWVRASTLDRAVRWLAAVGADTAMFAAGFVTLTLKTSIPPCREPVFARIGRALRRTAVLALAAIVVALAIGVPLGLLAAARRGTPVDTLATVLAVAGASVPRFWLGPVLVLLFAVVLDWLPVSGYGSAGHLVLPALTLGAALAALLSRTVRASMLDVLEEEYLTAARARGISEARLLTLHAFRNASLPVVTVFGLELGALFGGAVVTEKVFAWPGLGTLLLTAIDKRDFNTVRACVLVLTLSYILVNLATDVVYSVVDPRLRETR